MINISKQGDSIVFSFDNNDRYLQNGQITVPVNSLSLSFDKSGFATFKKAATNDVFLEFFPENSNLATKENVINFYVNNMVNIDGGGSSGEGISDAPSDGKLYGRKNASWTEVPSGITAGDVDSKIATAVADLATDADLQAVSGKVDENIAAIGGKQDILVSGTNIKTVNGEALLGSGNISIQGGGGVGQTYSGSTNGEIFNDYTNNVASGKSSHAEGKGTTASGQYSHAEGSYTKASGDSSHAEGSVTFANGKYSHAEGGIAYANGDYSHAEGYMANANGDSSHAEGYDTIASGHHSHAEGWNSQANGNRAHAEGYVTNARGEASHAEGYFTKTNNQGEHAEGYCNVSHKGSTEADKTIHSIGVGTSTASTKNAVEVMTNGDYYVLGVGGYDGTNYLEASTVQEVISALTEASGSTSGGGITDAPSDGKLYGRKNASWTEVPSGITAGDVDSKIATAVANLATDADLQAVSGKVDENTAAIGGKQDTLVSGENIKTVNGQALLGSGNISIQGGGVGQNYQGSTNGEIFNDYSNNVASGEDSHAEGKGTTASGNYSHAEGRQTIASGDKSHAEGYYTKANGSSSHAEGTNSMAIGLASHAEGQSTTASGDKSHAEGQSTTASGDYSHAEGSYTLANNESEHAQGKYNKSNTGSTEADNTIHSIGIGTSEDDRKNAQEIMTNGDTYIYGIGGYDGTNYTAASTVQEVISALTESSGSTGGGITAGEVDSKIDAAIASKQDTLVSGTNIKTINGQSILGDGNINITVSGSTSGSGVGQTYQGSQYGEIFNDYTNNVASGNYSHAEGQSTSASGWSSHAEGSGTKASGRSSHAEGNSTVASGDYSHAEGIGTTASGSYSHAEGRDTIASDEYSHAEGNSTSASSQASHAEGYTTNASGEYSHAEGSGTIASGQCSHAEGFSTSANGLYSHVEGNSTIANNAYEHAQGKYNKSNTGSTNDKRTIHSIGIGMGDTSRKNAVEVMTNGDAYIYGIGGYDGTNYSQSSTVQKMFNSKVNLWKGSQSEYDGLGSYDLGTLYVIKDSFTITKVYLGDVVLFGA